MSDRDHDSSDSTARGNRKPGFHPSVTSKESAEQYNRDTDRLTSLGTVLDALVKTGEIAFSNPEAADAANRAITGVCDEVCRILCVDGRN